jgi:outer membrane protein with beta-barrel domain
MNRLRASLLKGSILALAAACALEAHAQAASPPPGKALVVLYRSDKQPVAARVPVIANADRLGDLGNGEFINAVVNPGRTFLRVGDRILTTLAIQTNANQTAYVLVEAVPGLTPVRVEMREMTEASARRALAQSRPAAAGAVAAAPPRAPAPAPRAPAAAAPLAAAPLVAAPRPAAPAAAPPPPRPVQPSPPPQPVRGPLVREPVAAEEEEEAAEAERGKWRIAVIAKTGAFKLTTTSQTIGGLTTAYDKNSKPVAALEAEMRHLDGFAIGAEVLYYKNDITISGTPFTGQQSVVSTTVNAKYYLGGDTGVFHPFVGAGVGFAGANFGGDLQGKSSGPSFQGMLGVDLRFSSVGLYLEYKYVSSTTSDSTNQKIKIGGSGVLAGVSLDF